MLATGATGYVGGRLVPELLEPGYRVRVMARDPAGSRAVRGHGAVEVVRADATRATRSREALRDVDVAYYLIHSLGLGADFEDRTADRDAPSRPRRGGRACSRIVYLGGLAPADEELSPHLRSRAEVGEILLDSRRADRGAARRGHHRLRLGVVRDAALPHRAAAGRW